MSESGGVSPDDGLDPAVTSTGPAELLTMVYDRLERDVQRGLDAQRRGDHPVAHRHLTHALDIVTELQRSIDIEDFRGGYDLAALYEFLHRRLVLASIGKGTAITDDCLELVNNLCAGWREASRDRSSQAGHRAAVQRSA